MVRPRAKKEATPDAETRLPWKDGMDVNAIVSYNVRVARERRGMTQEDVAEGLARLTGHRLPQASISAMERGVDGTRRRRFDAHELYLHGRRLQRPDRLLLPPAPRHRRPGPRRRPASGQRALCLAAGQG